MSRHSGPFASCLFYSQQRTFGGVARVRNNFLKKKLGLTDSDADLDKAIMSAAEKMKGDRTKNRVTVYYLLAAHFGKLSMFN